MKNILLIMILVLLLLYIKNKRELFSSNDLIIGGVDYDNFNVSATKINNFLDTNGIEVNDDGTELNPLIKKMKYTLGEEGVGQKDEVSTYSLDVESVREIMPDAITNLGGVEIVDLKATVPLLFKIIQNNTDFINKHKLEFVKLQNDFIELKKKIVIISFIYFILL